MKCSFGCTGSQMQRHAHSVFIHTYAWIYIHTYSHFLISITLNNVYIQTHLQTILCDKNCNSLGAHSECNCCKKSYIYNLILIYCVEDMQDRVH